jgi:hypothetical protein
MAEIVIQAAASFLFSTVAKLLNPTKIEGQKTDTLDRPSSQYGDGKAKIWGEARIVGTLIWATNKVDRPYVTRSKGSETTNHTYFASFAYLIGEGPLKIQTIWLNNKVWYSVAEDASAEQLKLNAQREKYFTFYEGNETQLPDPYIQSDLGVNRTPGYRGSAYIVFKDLSLADYGESFPLPNFRVVSANSYVETANQRKGLVEGQSYTVTVIAYDNTGYRHTFTATTPNAVWGVRVMNVTPMGQIGIPRGEIQLYGKGFTKTIAAGNEWGTVSVGSPGSIEITDISPPGLASPSVEAIATSDQGYTVGVTAEVPAPLTLYFYAIQYTRASDNAVVTVEVRGAAPFWVGNIANANQTPPTVNPSYFSAPAAPGQNRSGDTILCRSGRPTIPTSIIVLATFPGGVLGIHGWVRINAVGQAVSYQPMLYQHDSGFGNVKITKFWSNTKPQVGSTSSTGQSLSSILEYVMAGCGIKLSQYDFSAVSSITVRGYRLGSVTQAKTFLDNLQRIYLFAFYRDGGKLVAKPYGEDTTKPVEKFRNKFLRFDGEPQPYKQIIVDPEKFNSTLQLTYFGKELNLRPASQISRRYPDDAYRGLFDGSLPAIEIEELNVLQVNTEATLTNAEGLTLAHRMFSILLSRRRSYEWIWPLTMLEAQLNEVFPLELTYSGFIEDVIITSIDIAKNNSLVIKAESYDRAFQSLTLTAETPASNLVTSNIPTSIDYIVFDISQWRAENTTTNVLYVGAYAKNWNGATVFVSIDGGGTYQQVSSLALEATIGSVVQQLEPNVDHELIDYASTLTIQLYDGSAQRFASINDTAFANNTSNLLLVGNEIVKFKTATLVGLNQYELKTFRRGLFGTWPKIGTHQGAEEATLLDTSIVSVPYSADQINTVVQFRLLATRQNNADATSSSVVPRGNFYKPLPVVNISSVTNPNEDILISWNRVARGINDWIDFIDVPLLERVEKYSIDILDMSQNYKKTVITTSPFFTYPLADRIADLGSATSFIAEIYQLSDLVGRGLVSRATIQV